MNPARTRDAAFGRNLGRSGPIPGGWCLPGRGAHQAEDRPQSHGLRAGAAVREPVATIASPVAKNASPAAAPVAANASPKGPPFASRSADVRKPLHLDVTRVAPLGAVAPEPVVPA